MLLLASWLACGTAPPPSPAPAPTVAAPVGPESPAPPPAPPTAPLEVPDAPPALAARLVEADARILDPSVPDELAATWGHAQQRVFRRLADDPVLATAVLAAIADPVQRERFERWIHGTREIALTAKPRTDLPDWRIVPPPPPGALVGYYEAAAQASGVPWSVLAAIHLNETRMGRLRGVSPAGAQGPMQFMPTTWKAYGTGDVNAPADAIAAAGNYLAKMGWAKDPDKALWHYNHSPHYVAAIRAFAEVLDREPRLYRGLWGWQVYYRTIQGSIWLSEGYAQEQRVPIEAWCAGNDALHCPPVH